MKLERLAMAMLPALLTFGAVAEVVRRVAPGPPITEASQILMAGGSVESLVLSPDGSLLAAGVTTRRYRGAGQASYLSSEVQLWDTRNGYCTWTLPTRAGTVTAIAFGADGRTLLTGSRRRVDLWDSRTGAMLRACARYDGISMLLGFSPDGRQAIGTSSIDLEAWDVRTGEVRWREARPGFPGVSDPVISATFSPDGRVLAIGSEVGVSLWQVPTRGALPQVRSRLEGHEVSFPVVAFSPDGTVLAAGGAGGMVTLWAVRNRDAARSSPQPIRAHSRGVEALAFAPDGRSFASAGGRAWNEGGGKEIRVWQLPRGTLRQRLVGHEDRVTAIAFQRDGRGLVSGSQDGSIRLWPGE